MIIQPFYNAGGGVHEPLTALSLERGMGGGGGTFLRDNNSSLFNIPGYAFLSQNRKTKSRGGVALYIRNDMKYKRRTDIELNLEGEFESIFAEIMGNPKSTIIGQIYRVPNTNETQSIERYRTIIDKISHPLT